MSATTFSALAGTAVAFLVFPARTRGALDAALQKWFDALDALLSAILDGKRLGFTLTEIRDMLADKRRDGTKAKLALSLPEIEDQIEHLEAQKAQIEDALRELRRQHERLRAAA